MKDYAAIQKEFSSITRDMFFAKTLFEMEQLTFILFAKIKEYELFEKDKFYDINELKEEYVLQNVFKSLNKHDKINMAYDLMNYALNKNQFEPLISAYNGLNIPNHLLNFKMFLAEVIVPTTEFLIELHDPSLIHHHH